MINSFKNFSFLILFSASLYSCGGKSTKSKKASKKELFGKLEKDTYKNSFFNLEIDFNEQWEVTTKSFKTGFGGELFEAVLISSENEFSPLNITIEADKANPFKTPSIIEKANESIEAYEFLFDKEDMIKTPMSKTTIAGKEYVVTKVQLIDEGDTTFVNEYYTLEKGYYLSIYCVFNTELDGANSDNFIANIKKLK